jgi:hypothetical protein
VNLKGTNLERKRRQECILKRVDVNKPHCFPVDFSKTG